MTNIHRHTKDGHLGRRRAFLEDFEKNQLHAMKGKDKFFARLKRIYAYLDNPHSYQLFYGNTPFGRPQILTGAETSAKNKAYEDKFYNALNVDKCARLWRLKLVREEDA